MSIKETVLNISQNFEIQGGSDIYFHSLCKLLQDNGHHVDNFAATLDKSSQFPQHTNFDDRTIDTILKYIYNMEAKKKITKFIDAKDYNIAHLHIYYGKLSSSILSPLRRKGIPLVQTLHEYKLVCPTYKLYDGSNLCFACQNNKFYNATLKKCNRGSFARSLLSSVESYVSLANGSQKYINHFITVSDFQREQIINMGFDPARLSTVHNFLDIKEFPYQQKDGDYVLYYGRIEKVKGLEVLLKSLDFLPNEIKIVIVGDGEFKTEMVEKIEDINRVEERVIYLGFLRGEALRDVINNSKFVVVPSIWYETFGLTVIESMAYGKPVIGSKLGGITEIIADGIDGYLVEPNNAKALAEKIESLYSDDHLIQCMGSKARRKIEDQFSAKRHYEKLLSIYKSVANS